MKPDPKAAHLAETFAHDAPLITCRFDPKGLYVFATAEDRSVIRWELATGKKTVLKAHGSWVGALAFSPDGATLVTGGYDDTLIWWPVAAEKPEPIRKVKAHNGWIRALAVSPDGKLLASGGNDRIAKLWSLADGAPIREMPGHELDIYSALFHPAGKFLLTGDLMGKINQWDLATGKLARTFESKDLHHYDAGQQVHFGGVRGLALSPDGKHLACGGLHKATNPLGMVHEPLVVRFDWETQKILKSHLSNDNKGGVIWRVVFHPEGHLIACCGGSTGGFLLFWGPADDKPAHQFNLTALAREMDLHPDGLRLATAHFDRKLRITKLIPKAPEKGPEKPKT